MVKIMKHGLVPEEKVRVAIFECSGCKALFQSDEFYETNCASIKCPCCKAMCSTNRFKTINKSEWENE